MKDGTPTLCRIRSGWADAGKEGSYYGKHFVEGRWWCVVKWDDDDEPEVYKAEAIEVSTIKFEPIQP